MFVASEGWCCRYEVVAMRDGYLVQMRDVSTGDLDEEFSTLFRSLPVAMAYAVMSAAYERFSELEVDDEGFEELEAELELSEQNFMELSDRLGDSGHWQGHHVAEQGGAGDHEAPSHGMIATYH